MSSTGIPGTGNTIIGIESPTVIAPTAIYIALAHPVMCFSDTPLAMLSAPRKNSPIERMSVAVSTPIPGYARTATDVNTAIAPATILIAPHHLDRYVALAPTIMPSIPPKSRETESQIAMR